MAQVTTGNIYECQGHSQEGHELAEGHPVIVVGRQELIDNQRIAIVIPLTSTRPNHPVHWAVEIEDTDSSAYLRHIKSVHISKVGKPLGTANPEEMSDIREGLARELQYDNHEPATALGQEVHPGSLWSASIPNALGPGYEGDLLILTSNHQTGLATALAVDQRKRTNPRHWVPVRFEDTNEIAFAIIYQVRSISVAERLTGYRGQIQAERLATAKSALVRSIES